MFRCCIPCRGGSAAPATSPPNSPIPSDELNNINIEGGGHTIKQQQQQQLLPNQQQQLQQQQQQLQQQQQNNKVTTPESLEPTSPISKRSDTSDSPDDIVASIASSISNQANSNSSASSTPPSRVCQPQTSPLPHIKEEEESEQNQHPPLQLSRTTPASLFASDRHSQRGGGAGSGSGGGGISEEYSSSPSPRIKLKIKKHIKSGWNRTVVALATNSSETLTSSGSAYSGAGSIGGGCGSGSAASNVNHSSNLVSSNPQSGSILPKMQAEQGSIGDLQKYHSRYLKNRRHTLANVR